QWHEQFPGKCHLANWAIPIRQYGTDISPMGPDTQVMPISCGSVIAQLPAPLPRPDIHAVIDFCAVHQPAPGTLSDLTDRYLRQCRAPMPVGVDVHGIAPSRSRSAIGTSDNRRPKERMYGGDDLPPGR